MFFWALLGHDEIKCLENILALQVYNQKLLTILMQERKTLSHQMSAQKKSSLSASIKLQSHSALPSKERKKTIVNLDFTSLEMHFNKDDMFL
jgi:hypothetical protein